MRLPTDPLPGTVRDPRFPDTDEDGRGASDFHTCAVLELYQALKAVFASDPSTYVTCMLIFCYEEDRPVCRIDPDVLVARGAGKHLRHSWCIRDEKGVPNVLFEVVSAETWQEDLYEKRPLYARLGVKEYFLFDPEAEFLRPTLQGFRLERGESVPLSPAGDGSLRSEELGLQFIPEGGVLRVVGEETKIIT
jgi:Uma2 family endonuclease